MFTTKKMTALEYQNKLLKEDVIHLFGRVAALTDELKELREILGFEVHYQPRRILVKKEVATK